MAGKSDDASVNPFWDFSLRFYARPGVAETCLALQDTLGVDVNVLFYLLWLADAGKIVSQDELDAIDGHVKTWRDEVVAPLRKIRRGIRKSDVNDALAEFRKSIKKLELNAEHIEQDKLFSLFQKLEATAPVTDAARKNLENYARYLGREFGGDAEKLLAAFDARE